MRLGLGSNVFHQVTVMAVPLLLLIQKERQVELRFNQSNGTKLSASHPNVGHLPAELVQLSAPVVSALFAWPGARRRAPVSHSPPSFSRPQPEPPASARSLRVAFAVE